MYSYQRRIVSVAVDFTRSAVVETIAVTLLEIRGNRVRVRMPPCEIWPEGHDTWLDRKQLIEERS
jgi:hypothetical protein